MNIAIYTYEDGNVAAVIPPASMWKKNATWPINDILIQHGFPWKLHSYHAPRNGPVMHWLFNENTKQKVNINPRRFIRVTKYQVTFHQHKLMNGVKPSQTQPLCIPMTQR